MATIKGLHKPEEIFENCWHDAVREIGEPASYAVDLKKIDYNEFIEKINTNSNNFIKDFVFSFYSGRDLSRRANGAVPRTGRFPESRTTWITFSGTPYGHESQPQS